MCVVSMIYDYYHWKWNQPPYQPWPPYDPTGRPPLPPSPITPGELEEFRKLLERAREYDRNNNQPDCELEEKKRRLVELAKELGAELTFPEEKEDES